MRKPEFHQNVLFNAVLKLREIESQTRTLDAEDALVGVRAMRAPTDLPPRLPFREGLALELKS